MSKLGELKKKYFYMQVTKHNPDLDWLISEIGRLRKALMKYGNHARNCKVVIGGSAWEQCTCGYEQALKEGEDG